MKIHGLQKMTLLDFPGKVACTVFLGGCNFRCPYCHNYELACGRAPAVMESAELLDFLGKRQGLLDGVAITGGEPCLHKDLPQLLRDIRALGFATKLDTNGYFPEMLGTILDEGLVDYVAMDIKNSPIKYAVTAGLDELDLAPVTQSIGLLLESSVEHEFRTTVVAELHEADDFRAMGAMIAGAKRYYLQGFTDRDAVPFEGLHAPSTQQLEEYARIAQEYVSSVELRGVE